MHKAQRNWLIMLFSGPVLLALLFLGIFVIASSIYPLDKVSLNLLVIFLITLIPVAILYHCSYKKKGTALLTWCIWLGSIGLGIAVIEGIVGLVALMNYQNFPYSDRTAVILVYCGMMLFSCGINVAWIITCMNLKKFNLRWKALA